MVQEGLDGHGEMRPKVYAMHIKISKPDTNDALAIVKRYMEKLVDIGSVA